MRIWSPLLRSHYAARKGRYARLLFWVAARDRDTQQTETLGLWTGDDHLDFEIAGEIRTYYGAGTLLGADPLNLTIGLEVRTQRVVFSAIAPEVELALRGYDTKLAPVEMHLAHFDPLSGVLLEEPEPRFKGVIDQLEIITPEAGGEAAATCTLISAAYRLRNTLSLKKSDAALRARAPDDGFRKDTDMTGSIDAVWGELRASAPPANDPSPSAIPSRPTAVEEPR